MNGCVGGARAGSGWSCHFQREPGGLRGRGVAGTTDLQRRSSSSGPLVLPLQGHSTAPVPSPLLRSRTTNLKEEI